MTQGPLAVTVFPVVGTEGTAIASAPIATFIDAGGRQPCGVVLRGGTVRHERIGPDDDHPRRHHHAGGQFGPQYTVTAPAFTLPEEGTYQIQVTITDTNGTP